MRILIVGLASCLALAAQDAKVAPPKEVAQAVAAQPESLFTPEEGLKIENAILRISLANQQYKIDEYQKLIAPESAAQDEIISAKCMALGIPKDKVRTECGVAGFGQDGKQPMGPDGKPIPRKVYWAKPQAVSAADALAKPEKK